MSQDQDQDQDHDHDQDPDQWADWTVMSCTNCHADNWPVGTYYDIHAVNPRTLLRYVCDCGLAWDR